MVRLSLNPSPGVAGEGASCTAGKESGTLRKGKRGRNTAKLPWGITAPEGSSWGAQDSWKGQKECSFIEEPGGRVLSPGPV